jgi:hypothetical protein
MLCSCNNIANPPLENRLDFEKSRREKKTGITWNPTQTPVSLSISNKPEWICVVACRPNTNTRYPLRPISVRRHPFDPLIRYMCQPVKRCRRGDVPDRIYTVYASRLIVTNWLLVPVWNLRLWMISTERLG